MSRAKLVDYYIEKSRQPGFEIDSIRKELEPQDVPDEDIRIIIKLVDNAMHQQALAKNSNHHARELILGGALLTIVGAGITIGTYTGAISMGNSFLIVYGPFFGGLSMFLGGLALRR